LAVWCCLNPLRLGRGGRHVSEVAMTALRRALGAGSAQK
jgi:hypothetical protein